MQKWHSQKGSGMLFLQGQKISEELNMRISLSAGGCSDSCRAVGDCAGRAALSALYAVSPCLAVLQVCPSCPLQAALAQTSLCSERQEAGVSAWRIWLLRVLSQQICPALPGVSWSGHLPHSLSSLVLRCSWQHWGPLRSCVVPIVTLPGNRIQVLGGEQCLAL